MNEEEVETLLRAMADSIRRGETVWDYDATMGNLSRDSPARIRIEAEITADAEALAAMQEFWESVQLSP